MSSLEDSSRRARAMANRIQTVAANAVRSGLRHRIMAVFAFTALALLLISRRLGEMNFGGSELRFVGEFGLAAIGISGMLLVPLLAAQLFVDDLNHGVLACLLSGRLHRAEYLAGLGCGLAVVGGLFVVGEGAVLWWLAVRASPASDPWLLALVLGQACGLIWLKVLLGAAMTLFVSTYASTAAFAGCVGVMLMVAAHLRELTPAHGAGAWLRVCPNLDLFDASAVWTEQTIIDPGRYFLLMLYAASYLVVFGALSAWVLSRREL